jgi:hypothetical protein
MRPDRPPPARARSRRSFRCRIRLPPTRDGQRRAAADNGAPQMPPPPGMRGFRDIAADADDLGAAAQPTARAKTYANVPSPSPEFDRLEPSMENRGADPRRPILYEDRRRRPTTRRSRRSRASARGCRRTATASRRSAPARRGVSVQERDCGRHRAILVGAGILWGRSVSAVSGLFKSSQVAEAPKDPAAPQSRPKIPDRVGQPSPSENVAPVAQRVVLYDEDPSDPKGKQYVGSVIWRTEPIKASGNQKADIAVRADIEIPDRKFKMTMSFRRNTDTSLPASHTAERPVCRISPAAPATCRHDERAGAPPPDLAVKVTDGFSGGPVERRCRSVAQPQLLKERSWVDAAGLCQPAPCHHRYREGRPGERLQQAFAAWGE